MKILLVDTVAMKVILFVHHNRQMKHLLQLLLFVYLTFVLTQSMPLKAIITKVPRQ